MIKHWMYDEVEAVVESSTADVDGGRDVYVLLGTTVVALHVAVRRHSCIAVHRRRHADDQINQSITLTHFLLFRLEHRTTRVRLLTISGNRLGVFPFQSYLFQIFIRSVLIVRAFFGLLLVFYLLPATRSTDSLSDRVVGKRRTC